MSYINLSTIKEFTMMQELATDKEALERLLENPMHINANRSRGQGKSEEMIPSWCPLDGDLYSNQDCYALASITPLIGVSDRCRAQSLTYLIELFSDNTNETWARKSKIGNYYWSPPQESPGD